MGDQFRITAQKTRQPHARAENSATLAVLGSARVRNPALHIAELAPLRLLHLMENPAAVSAAEARQIADAPLAGTPCPTSGTTSPVASIVEISRAECLRRDGRFFSRAEIRRRFASLLSDPRQATAYFRLLSNGTSGQIAQYLRDLPGFDALPKDDARLLRDMRPHVATEASLEDDLAAIATRLPNCLFVSHFAAYRDDGTPLRARRNFIGLVTSVLRRLQLPVFDPSGYVDAFGQTRAVAPGTPMFSRYVPEFERFLAEQWMSTHLHPHLAQMPPPRSAPAQAPASRSRSLHRPQPPLAPKFALA